MRNFSKTLISMAAVMAVGSAMAAGAMAADLTATYADDTVTFSGVTEGKSQYTLLVVQGTTAEGATEVTYDANESTIKQIDQNDDGTAFTSAVVGELADGSYKVMVGNNDGTVDSGIFEVSSAPVVEYRSYTIGDIDDNGRVITNDLTYLKKKIGRKPDGFALAGTVLVRDTGVNYTIGDIDDNGRVITNDLTYLKKKIGRKPDGFALAGTAIQVVK